MEAFPSGAAARLVLTPNALHRHARRAQREMAALGITKNLAASQEFLAWVLGMTNWHEAQQMVHVPAVGTAVAPGSHDANDRNAFVWADEPPVFDAQALHRLLLAVAPHGFTDVVLQVGERIMGERYGRLKFIGYSDMAMAKAARRSMA